MRANPLLVPSELPYGLPRLDRITPAHFLEAIDVTRHEELEELEAIAADPESPTFENTLAALELAGRRRKHVSAVFASLRRAVPGLEEINAEMTRLQTELADALWLDVRLWKRVRALYDRRDELGLDPESERLLERYRTRFIRAGALLAPTEKATLRLVNQSEAALMAEFSRRVTADRHERAVLVDDVAELDGLPKHVIAAAADAARERGHPGKFLIRLALPAEQPVIADAHRREFRKLVHDTCLARNSSGGNLTAWLVSDIAWVRAQRARLLGWPSHAAYVVEDSTVGSLDRLDATLTTIAEAAVRAAERERTVLQRAAADAGHDLEPWDWAYYARRLLDLDALQPYLEVERVLREGVFHVAQELYGLRFVERPDLPVHHPNAKAFEVYDGDTPLGLLILDIFSRAGKGGGAWTESLATQAELTGARPIVMMYTNIDRQGEQTLLTLDEVDTIFHEFGHVFNALLSQVRYPSLGWLDVPWDYIEFPGLLNESWATDPAVMANYARHHLSGEAPPDELLEAVRAAHVAGKASATVQELGASALDQALHRMTERIADLQRFENHVLERAGLAIPEIGPRYRLRFFLHIVDAGYAATDYAYLWSDILAADARAWFDAHGGVRRKNGQRFRREVLAKGATVDAMEAYRRFTGREPRVEPLLERRGLLAR